MENMDKGLTVPKCVLMVWPKISQMPHNLSAQFVCPCPKDCDFNEKRLHWASVVHGLMPSNILVTQLGQSLMSYSPHGFTNFKSRIRIYHEVFNQVWYVNCSFSFQSPVSPKSGMPLASS